MAATVNRIATRAAGCRTGAELRPHAPKGRAAKARRRSRNLGGEVSGEVPGEFPTLNSLGAAACCSMAWPNCWTPSKPTAASWGIVTQQAGIPGAASPAATRLGRERCAILVGGDSLPQRKPASAAAAAFGGNAAVDIATIACIGDDQRDIDAARARQGCVWSSRCGAIVRRRRSARMGGDVLLVRTARDLLDPVLWSALR